MSTGIDTASTRQLIAAALAPVVFTVDGKRYGLSAHASTPPTIATWDAWPVLTDVRPVTGCVAETDWHVYVALPAADQTSLVEAGDAVIEPCAEALAAVGAAVAHVRPARWPVADGGEVPVWQFEITI